MEKVLMNKNYKIVIVPVTARKNSGKDYLVNKCLDYIIDYNKRTKTYDYRINFDHFYFANPIEQFFKNIFGDRIYNNFLKNKEQENEEVQKLLPNLSVHSSYRGLFTGFADICKETFGQEIFATKLKTYLENDEKIIKDWIFYNKQINLLFISDVRYYIEEFTIQEIFRNKLYNVADVNWIHIFRDIERQHISEQEKISDYQDENNFFGNSDGVHYKIENNGSLEEFDKKIYDILNKIIEGAKND